MSVKIIYLLFILVQALNKIKKNTPYALYSMAYDLFVSH